MAKRIENNGGAYNFYHREPVQFEVQEELERRQFVSYNKIENGITGIPLGDGLFIHEGVPTDEAHLELDSSIELTGRVTVAERQKARIETSMATEEVQDYSKNLDDKIVSAEPYFDFQTNKAELVVRFANGKSKIIKKTCYEVASWLLNKSTGGLLD